MICKLKWSIWFVSKHLDFMLRLLDSILQILSILPCGEISVGRKIQEREYSFPIDLFLPSVFIRFLSVSIEWKERGCTFPWKGCRPIEKLSSRWSFSSIDKDRMSRKDLCRRSNRIFLCPSPPHPKKKLLCKSVNRLEKKWWLMSNRRHSAFFAFYATWMKNRPVDP